MTEKYQWCSNCQAFQMDEQPHKGHQLVNLGDDLIKTISALDDIIEYGQDAAASIEQDVANARRVQSEIQSMREKFKATLMSRIEKIVQDLRVALDEQSMQLLGDVDKKVSIMEENARKVIQTSRMKLDTTNTFLEKAATALPDDNGNFEEKQLKDIYQHYKTLQKVVNQEKPKVESVSVDIKFPNTMKVKTECRELSKRIIGEIANTKRPSLLDAQRASIDVANINDFKD
ncbi:protein FAM184A-like [Clytia hemisphaerica]|uniref:Uncharacterized protein n=1 Tax=Clytia hemisphaerica TaxID=252671 RepID=A0A7M5WJD1_9CNID